MGMTIAEKVLAAHAGRRQFVLAPGVYDGLTAKIAGAIGFDALYMTGFGPDRRPGGHRVGRRRGPRARLLRSRRRPGFRRRIRTRADLDAYVDRVVKPGLPALYNGALVPAAEAEALGFRIQILAGAALISAYDAVCRALRTVKDTGQLTAGPVVGATPAAGADVPDIRDLLGLPDVYERERRYQVTT